MKAKTLLLIAFVCLSATLQSQDGYSEKKDSLQSEILNQKRKLSIFLPEGYDAPNAKFPVIYVLDADGRCQHTVPTARFLFLNNKMPKAIIVGVFNVDRNHDFLPASTLNIPTGGGADKFIQFFKKELIPYIEQKYKTDAYKVLEGHSFGGVFAMHALLNEPDLFDAYIAIDPSFWYNNKMQVKSATTAFKNTRNWNKSLYITGRKGEGMKGMAIDDMEKQLKISAPKELNWKIVSYAGEDHGSVTFKSVYDGFRFIFEGSNSFNIYPLAGTLPKGESTYALIENAGPNLRYTLDGSEPDINSSSCKDKIKISQPCTLKVKSISRNYNSQPAVTRVFVEGGYMQGISATEKLKPGLSYSYYEGVWDSLPDFSKLTPVKTGTHDNIDLKMALKKDSFAVLLEGYLHITEKALYNLWIVSDDGTKFYFNNELLLNNDGLHGAGTPVVKLVPLSPGYYPIKIAYFEKAGDEVVSFGALKGIKNPIPIPKELLFHLE